MPENDFTGFFNETLSFFPVLVYRIILLDPNFATTGKILINLSRYAGYLWYECEKI